MPAILDEHTQWVDSSGAPLVSGKVYIGDQSADPVANPQTIYSDRDLSTPITNPQTLDSLGRATNKIWVAGAYSIRVDDLNDVQIYQELDNGAATDVSTTSLTNVSGSNVITATDASGITAYVDLQSYIFRTVLVNTAAVTLNVNAIGAISVVKNHDQALPPSAFEAGQNVIVTYNATNDNFEWTNHNDKIVAFTEGANVASASTTDIWDSGGNTVHIDGTTTITSFGTSSVIGAVRWLIFNGVLTLSNSANLALPGGVNYTTAVGDVVRVYADSTTQFDVQVFPKDGTAVAASIATQAEQEAGTNLTATVTPARQQFHQSGAKFWVKFDGTAGSPITPTASYNVVDVTTSATGIFSVNISNDFSSANYNVSAMASGQNFVTVSGQLNGAIEITSQLHDGTLQDKSLMYCVGFGDR